MTDNEEFDELVDKFAEANRLLEEVVEYFEDIVPTDRRFPNIYFKIKWELKNKE